MPKSFYDLDYLIEINEKAAEKYTKAYDEMQGKYAIIVFIYSAITLFIVPLSQHFVEYSNVNRFFIISFIAFALCFVVSVSFTVKLILPTETLLPSDPKEFSDNIRVQYENQLQTKEPSKIDPLVKATYINDLQTVINVNKSAFIRKRSFFYYALIFALVSAVPFLFCLSVHLSRTNETTYKVKLVDTIKVDNLQKKAADDRTTR